MSVELLRHVNAVVSEFAADYGEVDLVGRRIECGADDYDRLYETFEQFDVVGGAGIRVRDASGRVLLARYEGADGWVDPGDSRRPGESYRECAKRALRETADIEASIDGLAQIQLLYMDDWTDREPLPNPYVSFEGSVRSGEIRTDGGVDLRWAESVPEELLYDELTELSLGGE